MSARSSDKVLELSDTHATPNTFVCILTRFSWIVSKFNDRFVQAPSVICLAAAESSFPLLLTNKPTYFVVDTSSEVEIEESDVAEPSAKRVRLCSTTRPIVSMSRSISTTNRLSIILAFVERVGTVSQLAETEDEIRGNLRAKFENSYHE